jgi:hypothetical protein
MGFFFGKTTSHQPRAASSTSENTPNNNKGCRYILYNESKHNILCLGTNKNISEICLNFDMGKNILVSKFAIVAILAIFNFFILNFFGFFWSIFFFFFGKFFSPKETGNF